MMARMVKRSRATRGTQRADPVATRTLATPSGRNADPWAEVIALLETNQRALDDLERRVTVLERTKA